jgi:hypothetical protein
MIGMHIDPIVPSRHAKLSLNSECMHGTRSKISNNLELYGIHISHSFRIELSRLQSTLQLVAWLPLVKRHQREWASHGCMLAGAIIMASHLSGLWVPVKVMRCTESHRSVRDGVIELYYRMMKQSTEFWNLQIDILQKKRHFLSYMRQVRNVNLTSVTLGCMSPYISALI